jgi:hypothetical protein
MEVEECADYAGGPLLGSLQEKLRVQLEGRIYNIMLRVERLIISLLKGLH